MWHAGDTNTWGPPVADAEQGHITQASIVTFFFFKKEKDKKGSDGARKSTNCLDIYKSDGILTWTFLVIQQQKQK